MWSLRFNWMPKCEWYMAMFVVRNMHRKGIKCHHEIGLCLQHILDISLGSIVNTIERVHVIIEKERGSPCCCCCYYCLLLLFPNLRYKLNVFTSMKTTKVQSQWANTHQELHRDLVMSTIGWLEIHITISLLLVTPPSNEVFNTPNQTKPFQKYIKLSNIAKCLLQASSLWTRVNPTTCLPCVKVPWDLES